jgi:hypothetical protein
MLIAQTNGHARFRDYDISKGDRPGTRAAVAARHSAWMMVYGDYLREIGYAVRKIGLTWDNVSDVDA